MENLGPCKHSDIAAKYIYEKSCTHDSSEEIRVFSWVGKEGGEHGNENEELPTNGN